MARQTIFVYLSEEDRAKGLLDAAIAFAERHASHLIGAFAVPPLNVYPMMGMELPAAVYEGHLQGYLEHAKKVETIFDEATRGGDFVAEWRLVDAGVGRIADALMDHVRCADMVIAPHYNAEERDKIYSEVAEELAMESGRPVLMIPDRKSIGHIGEQVMVAWDGSRESARAVFDSIETLKDADTVRIINVSEAQQVGSNAKLPAAEIAATLARRGVKCEVDHITSGDLSIGDAILARIGDRGSDMLVMGIYGHAKWRETIFGGATRKVLNQMTVPVMMSH